MLPRETRRNCDVGQHRTKGEWPGLVKRIHGNHLARTLVIEGIAGSETSSLLQAVIRPATRSRHPARMICGLSHGSL